MDNTDAMGWAVVSGRVLVNTVSETRRAAIVNYLVAHRGIMITTAWTDEDIERCWGRLGGDNFAQCTPIRITAAVSSPSTDK